ncbi:MAG: RagB/SusD family nutrient uptake outer membrane protein [Paludibacter sp.]|nr:RagB/SusD family nutrient uptake outer membrane protein [Paludibacter sp.]
MKIRNKIIYTLLLGISLAFFACEDFLDFAPNDRETLDNFFQSSEDLKTATAPLYNKVWFDFNDKFFYALGDGRANNLFAPYSDYIFPFTTLTETSLTGPLVSAWKSFYNVIGQSNNTINNIVLRAKNVTEGQKNEAIAEARFMRGTAYWYLASLWGDAIIITDNAKLVTNPIVPKNPRLDVMEFAIRDLEFAAKYLPEKIGEPGRLTRFSAFGMLSRAYLSMAGLKGSGENSGVRDVQYLNLARDAAKLVCETSEYKLMDNYEDLFKVANNNNSESLFALQWMPLPTDGNWGVNNTQQAYFAYSSAITGDDAAWGGWTMASYEVLKFYDVRDQIRRKATFMGNGDFYPEINSANGGFIVEDQNKAFVKKGVVGSQKDTGGKSSRMNSALNSYMLRLAEVYLIYAEAVLGNNASTTDPIALFYFNKVRTRVQMPEKTSITYQDIFYERRIELAMEGQFWYDLVRRSYYQQQEVLNFMENQERAQQYEFDAKTFTITATSLDATPVDKPEPKRLLMPYPESEVVQNPLLKEPPVPYVFTEEKITDLFN